MKKPWIKWGIIGLLAVIIFVIVVPIVINECYKANSGYMTIWGAADVLSYYGTILGDACHSRNNSCDNQLYQKANSAGKLSEKRE